ncbi:LLM class flavin-dependent oxidoreductase [Mycobacterium sp. SMC-21]|uniref:LLM class flavin-dependent oxidoreductase n=1 Tax=Mycobacterium sp. SMC-21 TaxID=3381632 RepID=UPI003875F4DA
MRFVMLTECETQTGTTHHRRYWDMVQEAVFAEEMGFDAWGTSEHHFFADLAVTPSPECLFTAVAMRTNRIRLRHMSRLISTVHPVLVAEQLATTDIFSNGRVEMATARGNTLLQLDAFGVSLDETKGRSEEALDLIVRALTNETFSHDGKYWGNIPERCLTPKGVQEPHPPLYKIVQSVESAEDAARKGLGMVTCDLYLGWENLEPQMKAYWGVPESEIKPVGAYAVRSAGAFAMTAVCAETNDEAMRRAEPGLLRAARAIINDIYAQLAERSDSGYHGFERVKELRDHVDDARYLRDLSPTIMVGDPDHCIEQIARYQALGADEIVLKIDGDTHANIMSTIEYFGRYVIPVFKNSSAVVNAGTIGVLPGDPNQKTSWKLAEAR